MKPKIIVYFLAAIVFSFVIKGFLLHKDIQETLKDNARQQEAATMEIGMCFDWYGVIIVNSVVKVSTGLITPEMMIETLEEERANKNEYLRLYKPTITESEKEDAEFVFRQDKKIAYLVDTLIQLAKNNNLEGISELIPPMYDLTDPTIEAINNLIDAKMYYNEAQSDLLNGKLESFSDFLWLLLMLSGVLCIGVSFSKGCK